MKGEKLTNLFYSPKCFCEKQVTDTGKQRSRKEHKKSVCGCFAEKVAEKVIEA